MPCSGALNDTEEQQTKDIKTMHERPSPASGAVWGTPCMGTPGQLWQLQQALLACMLYSPPMRKHTCTHTHAHTHIHTHMPLFALGVQVGTRELELVDELLGQRTITTKFCAERGCVLIRHLLTLTLL